eukprot:13257172-Alexandrium_andersonii.AAC.1
MAINQVRTHCCREDVGGVLTAGQLQQGEVPGAHALLRPQLAHCMVPDSPNAGATADTNGRAA